MTICKYLKQTNMFSIWVNVVPPDGIPRRIAGFKGESLLQVLQRTHTPGIFADCGGGD